jgi:hypothetical protein
MHQKAQNFFSPLSWEERGILVYRAFSKMNTFYYFPPLCIRKGIKAIRGHGYIHLVNYLNIAKLQQRDTKRKVPC